MAHTLVFDWLTCGKHQVGQIVRITEGHITKEQTVGVWNVIYKDNLNIIVERPNKDERRVYKVREWQRQNQCRATRME